MGLFGMIAAPRLAAGDEPSPGFLLDRYEEALSPLHQASIEGRTTITGDISDSYEYDRYSVTFEKHIDRKGKRYSIKRTGRGFTTAGEEVAYSRMQWISAGERGYHVTENFYDRPPGGILAHLDAGEKRETMAGSLKCQGLLEGRLWVMDGHTLGELLRRADTLNVEEDEVTDGLKTFRMEADTAYGEIVLWLAPEQDYRPVKMLVWKSGNDLLDDTPLTESSVAIWSLELRDVEFEQRDRTWFAKGATVETSITMESGEQKVSKFEYDRRHVALAPKFERRDAFQLEVPDGTPVTVDELRGLDRRYLWQDGVIVERSPNDLLNSVNAITYRMMAGPEIRPAPNVER